MAIDSPEKKIQDFVARPYQSKIIEVCKEKNSIVYLPTGAGKTFIAFQIIRHFSHQLEQSYDEGGMRSFFLVNTQVLAKQQAESAQKAFNFKVAIVTGEQNVDNFSPDDWNKLLNENQIFVMTVQCFADAITRSFINPAQVNVIIFDECHHGRKGHVMMQVMQNLPSSEMSHCRIIGLSGMLIGVDNSIKDSNVEAELKQLEATFNSTIITVNSVDDHQSSIVHSTKAKELICRFSPSSKDKCVLTVRGNMQKLIDTIRPIKLDNTITIDPKTLRPTIPDSIKDLQRLFKDIQYQIDEMGSYGAYLTLLSVLIQLELQRRFTRTNNFKTVLKVCITEIERNIHKMKKELDVDIKDIVTISSNSSNKIIMLITCLQEMFTAQDREKDLQCLVFCKRRSTAKALYHLIKYYAEYAQANGIEFPIMPDFVVGQQNELPNDIETIVNQSFNLKAIEKFTNKETNVIFCTNVLEEGIDLQLCNAVVMYDYPETFRSYMQSRGRARDDDSKYVVMIDNEKVTKFKNKMEDWKKVDLEMKRQLIGKTLDRESPSEAEVADQQAQSWDPFITKSGKGQLTAMNALTILNQYAQAMAPDRYSGSNIEWRRIDLEKGMIQVGIKLPPAITNEIIGDPKDHIKLAKQHAAFQTCIQLYTLGELTENMTPFTKEEKVELVSDDYFSHWKKYENDDKKKAGTRNNRREHSMKIPEALKDSSPSVKGLNFLYRIVVRPKFDTKKIKYLESFKEMLANGSSYGILTSKRLPRMCAMTLFPSYGAVECEIEGPPMQVVLKSEDELNKLRKFQVTLFRDVLQAWRSYYVIDQSSYVIVPLDESKQIDWRVVNEFQDLSTPSSSYDSSRKTVVFKARDYEGKIVSPTYRFSTDNYVVFNVRLDLSPLSPFPENFESYKEYYEVKYSLTARDDQFLLEVKAISRNWNVFHPGAGKSGENLRSYEKRAHSLFETLIPEFCHNFKFPADLWLKALLLPSALHRVHYMLLAEELRIWLIDEGMDEENGEQNYQLDIDYGDYSEKEANEAQQLENLSPEEIQKLIAETKNVQKKPRVTQSKALLMWDEKKLPLDLDRDWQNVHETEIDYYAQFMSAHSSKVIPSNVNHLRVHNGNGSSSRAIQDSEFRKDIKILSVNVKNSTTQQKDLIKVLTTSNAGDVFDMERFETLGDAFLKFISSLFLFKTHDKWNEGYLTTLKSRLVSNRNLFYIGNDFGLSTMLKTTKYNDSGKYYGLAPSTELPRNLQPLVRSNGSLLAHLLDIQELSDKEIEEGLLNETNLRPFLQNQAEGDCRDWTLMANLRSQLIGDKIIADAVEAFLGCVVQSVGIHSALKLCGKLGIFPKNGRLNTLLTEPIPPRIITDDQDVRVVNQRVLEENIGYSFTNKNYLLQALTHSSYPIKPVGTYEQLEFLGDAVLDFLITSYISEQCPKMDPGQLTDLRSALVNNVTLACIVVRNDLHKFMLYENHELMEAIKNFVSFQDSVQHKVTDQVKLLDNESDAEIGESVDVPKCLGDIFESIVGAVFLDSGLSLEKTWEVIYKLMEGELHEFMAEVPKQIVRQLYEFHKGFAEPIFYEHEDVNGEVAVPVAINCRVDGRVERKILLGIGKNKKLAKIAAAKRAMILLATGE